MDLFIHGFGIGHSHTFPIAIVVVLGLLAHGERSRDGHLDASRRMTAQKGDIAHLHRPRAANGTDHPWDSDGLSTPTHRGARRDRINTVQGRREAIRVALAADFPIADNIDPCLLHRPHRQQCGIILGLL